MEIAKNLLNTNLSDEDIAKATGLSIEEIMQLKEGKQSSFLSYDKY